MARPGPAAGAVNGYQPQAAYNPSLTRTYSRPHQHKVVQDGGGGGDTERLRKRIDDIKSGRARMTFYTLDEYMRHLDRIWKG